MPAQSKGSDEAANQVSQQSAPRIARMEGEHSRIRTMLDKATQAFIRQASISEVNTILLELCGYTLNHFREEETFMRACSFAGAAAHKQEHDRLAIYVRGLLDTSSKRDALEGALSALDYWLDTHIRVADEEFHNFLQSNAAGTISKVK